ncbi:hypothetical protein KAI12_04760, partial [Candidatus Bathyarchaeota archaeon]|nr:hypothetical protein [Candidatus Bathyarchaeota archaeon]
MDLKKPDLKTWTVVLGITCVLLIVGIGACFVHYAPVTAGQEYEIAALESEIEILQNQKTSLEAQQDLIIDELLDLDRQIANATTTIEELQSEILNLQDEIDDKDTELASLNVQLEVKNSEILTLQEQASSLQQQISNKDGEITDLNSQ